MKHTSKHNAGFTLIELVVAMAIAVIVTAAATSVLLMGLRVNRQTGDTASQQITVRTLLTTIENIVTESDIAYIEMEEHSWSIVQNEDDGNGNIVQHVVLSYFYDEELETGTVYVGDYRILDDQGEMTATPILTGVYSSYLELLDGLLTVYVETDMGSYSASVYCRTIDVGEQPEFGGNASRAEFIKVLKSQYRSRGEIIGADPASLYQYYSEWYCGLDYDDPGYTGDWNAKTPWCACFVSWALDRIGMDGPAGYCPDNETGHNHGNWFADVDEFMDYFEDPKRAESKWENSKANNGTYSPVAGDLIFFDWDKGTNPEHVGVVLDVKEESGRTTVYTIEGNSSGRVTIRSYSLTDERIIGYGVLWPTETTE